MSVAKPQAARAGLTLIELVVVLAIIAITAGMTVSVVGWVRQSANHASSAATMGDLLENLTLYQTTFSTYPNQFDSLLNSGGTALYNGNGTTDLGLWTSLQTPTTGKLTVFPLDANGAKSLSGAGITAVMDMVSGSGPQELPGNSGTSYRALASGGNVAILNTASSSATAIIDSIYPPLNGGVSGSGLPTTVEAMVVMGVGPRCTAVGATLVAPPVHAGINPPTQYYNRFLAVFAVNSNGSAAQLKAVLDAQGGYMLNELSEYYNSVPTQSNP